MEKDATAGGMRVEAEGKRKDKEKKEDTLLASNQGPDEPVYPRSRDAYFFFSLLFPQAYPSFFSLPCPLPRPQWPHRPLFSSPGWILAGVRGKRCPKVTARMDQIQDPCVIMIEKWEERRRIGELLSVFRRTIRQDSFG